MYERNTRAVRTFLTCANNIFLPPVLSHPLYHHTSPPPRGEVACFGCGLGHKAGLQWLL